MGDTTAGQWNLLILSVLASGLLGKLLQHEAQSVIPAASAQPSFALQPLFTALWCLLFLDEPLPTSLLGAALLMVGGALLASSEKVVEVQERSKSGKDSPLSCEQGEDGWLLARAEDGINLASHRFTAKPPFAAEDSDPTCIDVEETPCTIDALAV